MLESFRERLVVVQQELTSGLKTLSEKSRDAKLKKHVQKPPREAGAGSASGAGAGILHRYEKSWAELQRQTDACAHFGEVVDENFQRLLEFVEKQWDKSKQLKHELQQLPTLSSELDAVALSLGKVAALCEEAEAQLVVLEDLCEECESRQRCGALDRDVEDGREVFRRKREALNGQLAGEHAGRVRDAERCQQRKLRERQKFFEEAFQQDVEHYLSAGLLYSYTDRQALGSISSMEVNVDLLEQMDILDNSDQEALDVFLNGGADGTSEATGPDSSQENSLEAPGPEQSRCSASSSSTLTPTSNPTSPAITTLCRPSTWEGNDRPTVQPLAEDVVVEDIVADSAATESDDCETA
uniref:Dystrobrevin binding protein 1 n=1 Tax=Eptatretus burgeri TaxID=7764 RepID=A0A8C4NFA5_EPTBU